MHLARAGLAAAFALALLAGALLGAECAKRDEIDDSNNANA